MHIGLDLDDVLASWQDSFLGFYNRKHNTHFKRKEFSSYKLWEILGCEQAYAYQMVDEFYTSSFFSDIPPIPGSQKAIESLHIQGSRLSVITARPHYIQEESISWVEKHFPERITSVHFVGIYNENTSTAKKNICDKLAVDAFVEDNLDTAKACISQCRRVFLLDTPWNQGATNGIERVKSWEEIIQQLKI
ncbi:hypothetical protein HZA98_01330 [Candidatus Woesearchaeota archaeon]|nr:hypothetical protein [Candidatus Woesearchaeota archaeon]